MELYLEARQVGHSSRSLVEACQDCELPELDDHRPGDWCAGNEVMYLWSLFLKMAYGPNINDMYKTQFKVIKLFSGLTPLCLWTYRISPLHM
jgi:hypothetical protein